MNKVKVLFLAANPGGRLHLDEEIREITAKIRVAEFRDSLDLVSRFAVRPDDLQQALLEEKPHILHFSGHGSRSEEIILLDDRRRPKPVSKKALANLLGVLKDNIRLVVLNACYSRPQAEAITSVIDCAIGMKSAIGDEAAIKFAGAFYRGIGFGRSVGQAFDLGNSSLMLESIAQEHVPELLAREGVDPYRSFLVGPTDSTSAPKPPDAVRNYLLRLTRQTERLALLGMGRSLQIDLPISRAYVPLKTTMTRSFEARSTDKWGKGLAEHEEDVSLSDVFRKAADLEERGVVLLGEPGSGKTTGARQLAWRMASGARRPEELGLPETTVPVLLRFRNLTRSALDGTNGLRVLLDQETSCEQAPDGLQSPGPELWNGLGGPLLWILDGLDEVIDADDRKKVSGWIQALLRGRPEDRVLVTCRFQGYYSEGVPLGPEFVEFRVCPLDDRQVALFVESWFGAVAKRLHPADAPAQQLVEGQSGELLARLKTLADQSGSMGELCTNPLLLTILCIVYHETKDLPRRRAELYAHCVRVLLEYWRRDLYKLELAANLKPYDPDAAQAVLARLAWWMHQEQERTTAPLDDLAAEAERGLVEISPDAGLGLEGGGFLDRMRSEAGILALGGEGQGLCGFLHLSFQEYLAADHATREGLAAELAANMTESWWTEVGLLSLRQSRPFCEEFFRHLLEAGIAEDSPALLGRCLTESLYPAPKPFLEVLRASDDPRRVAAVLRLFRERAEQVPELRDLSLRFAEAPDPAIREEAQQILLRLGVKPKTRDFEVSIDRRTGISFVSIPSGKYQMGSVKGDPDEQPVHSVRISRGFDLGQHPVTNAQYRRFVEEAGVGKPAYFDDRRFNQPEQPVVGVSWEQARDYCEWAEGRLPTEAEWEYACRAGTETEFSFGEAEELLGEYGWFEENSSGQTQPVGTKKPNGWGLHDMHGNVWEWCWDWFAEDYYRESPGVDPRGPESGVFRVHRGGSWNSPPRLCRSAHRNGYTPSFRDFSLGFRVARSSASGSSGLFRARAGRREVTPASCR